MTDLLKIIETAAAAINENKKLNKPFRLPSGSKKKFGVYVKNDKGNIVMVKFGDPNMEIKRDDPERRKAYRARHGCESPGPKWKANYWSCKMWEAGKSVTQVTKGSVDFDTPWDGETVVDQMSLVKLDASLLDCEIIDEEATVENTCPV